jgi:hypothetical protein
MCAYSIYPSSTSPDLRFEVTRIDSLILLWQLLGENVGFDLYLLAAGQVDHSSNAAPSDERGRGYLRKKPQRWA